MFEFTGFTILEKLALLAFLGFVFNALLKLYWFFQLKNLFFIIFLLFPLHARADWSLIYSDKELSSYLNFSSLQKNDNYLRIWHLLNFTSPQNISDTSSFSVEVLWEIDCDGDRSRNLSSIWHADTMGKGLINYSSFIPTDWKSNSPQSLSKYIWFVVCTKSFI